MAPVKKKFKTPIVVAIDSGVTSALEGGPFPIRAGARFRADHPAVKAVPDLFVEDGTDDATIASLRTALVMETVAASAPPAPVKRPERRLRDEDAMVNTFNGSRLAKSDPLVKQHPDWFAPVVPPGLKRKDALLALASMRTIGDGGKPTRIVHANTWVHQDDPFVQLHPESFAGLMGRTAA